MDVRGHNSQDAEQQRPTDPAAVFNEAVIYEKRGELAGSLARGAAKAFGGGLLEVGLLETSRGLLVNDVGTLDDFRTGVAMTQLPDSHIGLLTVCGPSPRVAAIADRVCICPQIISDSGL